MFYALQPPELQERQRIAEPTVIATESRDGAECNLFSVAAKNDTSNLNQISVLVPIAVRPPADPEERIESGSLPASGEKELYFMVTAGRRFKSILATLLLMTACVLTAAAQDPTEKLSAERTGQLPQRFRLLPAERPGAPGQHRGNPTPILRAGGAHSVHGGGSFHSTRRRE